MIRIWVVTSRLSSGELVKLFKICYNLVVLSCGAGSKAIQVGQVGGKERTRQKQDNVGGSDVCLCVTNFAFDYGP